jgi:hypothetical protein
LVRDALPPGTSLTDLGVHRLKDLGRPERIFQLQAAGLQADFPPLRALGNPALPNNLPAQPATFIGRGREVAEVRALMKSSRLVTLTGAGGSGKTRLPDARVDPELFGAALVSAAHAASRDDIAAARRLGEQAVEVARQLGADRLLIESLAALSRIYHFAGELE